MERKLAAILSADVVGYSRPLEAVKASDFANVTSFL
jgi:class 3 adenylate cyclase